jgi:hypothetical protein
VDHLKGYESKLTTTEKTYPFHSSNFTEFWFQRSLTSGGHKWVRALKANVVPATPSSSFSASVLSTYQSSSSKTFTWDLSSTNVNAPIIGNVDTASLTGSSQLSEILYQEGGASTLNSWKDGVTNVWINAG